MAHLDENRKLSGLNLISYAMIKLSKCGGLYTKAIESWKSNTKQDKNIRGNFFQHLNAEYENLLAEGRGTTLGQEGYGAAFNAIEATMDESSIKESIFRCAERATVAEGNVQALEYCLNQLKIGNNQPPPQTAYYAPDSAYYTPHQPASGIPPTINFSSLAHQQWTVQATFKHQGEIPRKRVRNGSQRGGRQPAHFRHPPQYIITALSPPIPDTSTHSWLIRPRRTPSRKMRRSRKHAGNPHQQDQAILQSTLLFYVWI